MPTKPWAIKSSPTCHFKNSWIESCKSLWNSISIFIPCHPFWPTGSLVVLFSCPWRMPPLPHAAWVRARCRLGKLSSVYLGTRAFPFCDLRKTHPHLVNFPFTHILSILSIQYFPQLFQTLGSKSSAWSPAVLTAFSCGAFFGALQTQPRRA